MSNIACPHCRGLIFDDGSMAGMAVHCPACGGLFTMPTSMAMVPVAPPLPVAMTQPGYLACSHCGSEQVQSLSIVNRSGTTLSTGLLGGIGGHLQHGLHISGPVLGGGLSLSTSQTGLARSAAPPTMPISPYWLYFIFWCILLWLLLALPVAAIVIRTDVSVLAMVVFFLWLVGIPLAVQAVIEPRRRRWLNRQRAAYEMALDVWQRSFLCHRCGQIFAR